MIGDSDSHRKSAREAFRRLMTYTVLTAILTTVVALTYVGIAGSLNVTTVIATILGVFFSVTLGGGLMAVGFLSSNSGHDDMVSHLHPSAPEDSD